MTDKSENRASSMPPVSGGRAVRSTEGRARARFATLVVAVVVAGLTLGAAGLALLASGFIPLSGFEGRIARAVEDRLGSAWTVSAEAAEINREDGRSRLRVRQIAFRHASGASFRAPEAVLGYDPLGLLRGALRITSIDLRGLNVRLSIDRDGALQLEADSATDRPVAVEAPKLPPDPAGVQVFATVMNAVGVLAQGDGLLGALETAGLSGARLSLTDPDGREKVGLADVEMLLSRPETGVTRLGMRGRTGSRWKEIVLDVGVAADGTRRIDLDIRRFEPAEAVQLAVGGAVARLEGLPLSGKVSFVQAPDGKRSVDGTLRVGAGSVAVPQPGLAPIGLDQARFTFASADGLATIDLREADIQSGTTRLRGTGRLEQAAGKSWSLTYAGTGQLAGQGADPPVVLDTLSAAIGLDPAAGEIRIGSIALRGPAISADITGLIRRRETGPVQKLEITAVRSEARAILAAWPAFSSPELHALLSQKLEAGLISEGKVTIDLDEAGGAQLLGGGGMPDSAVLAKLQVGRVRFQPAPGLPPLVEAEIAVTATGRSVQVAVASAKADLAGGRSIALSDGSFAMRELWMRRAPAQIAFRATGGADGLAALFAFPALREFTPLPVEPGAVRGGFDLRTTLNLPMADDLAPSEVQVQSQGTLANLASDTLLGGDKLEAGNLSVSFDRNTLVARGEARVGGDRGAVDLKVGPKGQGEASLTLTLDNAARQRRGVPAELGVTGPVTVRLTKALGKAASPAPRVEADLTRAAIDGLLPGWSKAAGRPAKLAFTYVADKDGPDLDDLNLDSAPVFLRGKIELDKANGFESARFTQLKLSPGDDLKVDASKEGGVVKLVVRGAVGDARPFIKLMTEDGVARGGQRGQTGADLDLDLSVPILTGFNSEAIGNAALKLSRRGGETRSATFDGRIGKAPVSLRQPPGGPGVLQSADGGALMRFLDLYRRAYGGDLVLQTDDSGGSQRGELLLRNFVVRDEPALRRVIAEQTSSTTTGSGAASDRAGPAAGRIDATRVEFTKLRAEFTRSASRLDIADAVLWGNQIGFTVQGNVDFGRDRVDLGGTFVPGYAFNNAFAQVPVVGMLLGGGQYGGLFAVNFRIAGAASAPTMSVNPLSAIAPGILRRFVDPLGGGPLDRGGGTRPPAER